LFKRGVGRKTKNFEAEEGEVKKEALRWEGKARGECPLAFAFQKNEEGRWGGGVSSSQGRGKDCPRRLKSVGLRGKGGKSIQETSKG